MNPSTSLGTTSNVGMAKPSPAVRQAGNIRSLLGIYGVCRRSVLRRRSQVKYKRRCRVIPTDIEHGPPSAEEAGRSKILSHFMRSSIAFHPHNGEPGTQRTFGIRI